MTSFAHSWIEISKSAFERNVQQYTSIVGPHVNIAAVVKSNAYGHGLLKIAQLCQENKHINWLCTANLSEALILRCHGITKPILAMSAIDADLQDAIINNIDLMVTDRATITMLNTVAQQCNKKAAIHIKIDSGLARFGFTVNEALAVIQYASTLSHINLRGLFSHFAESDDADTRYTQQQLQQFRSVVATLEKHALTIPYIHISNSAAISSLAQGHFNFVRAGAGIYGLEPSPQTIAHAISAYPDFKLTPVMSWKTKLIAIRTVPANQSVGYSRTYTTQGSTRLGILPVGYYDGYDRRLSNKGMVLVHSATPAYAPVIGRVCMNATMIDLSLLPHSAIGDEVTLLGNHEQIQAHALANTIESYNPREITTRINPLIQRIVVE
jgi:alanine racemase